MPVATRTNAAPELAEAGAHSERRLYKCVIVYQRKEPNVRLNTHQEARQGGRLRAC